jgi:hypothetical protein
MLGVGAGLALYWRLDARRRFTGPTSADEAELRRVEAAGGGAR